MLWNERPLNGFGRRHNHGRTLLLLLYTCTYWNVLKYGYARDCFPEGRKLDGEAEFFNWTQRIVFGTREQLVRNPFEQRSWDVLNVGGKEVFFTYVVQQSGGYVITAGVGQIYESITSTRKRTSLTRKFRKTIFYHSSMYRYRALNVDMPNVYKNNVTY